MKKDAEGIIQAEEDLKAMMLLLENSETEYETIIEPDDSTILETNDGLRMRFNPSNEFVGFELP